MNKNNNSKTPSQTEQKSLLHREVSIHKGPIPTPEQLEKYEKTYPGAAKEIINMAVSQVKHRQEMEKMELQNAARDSLLGLTYAFIFCMVTITGAIYLILNDHTITGTLLGGVGFTTVVSAFIQGRTTNKKN